MAEIKNVLMDVNMCLLIDRRFCGSITSTSSKSTADRSKTPQTSKFQAGYRICKVSLNQFNFGLTRVRQVWFQTFTGATSLLVFGKKIVSLITYLCLTYQIDFVFNFLNKSLQNKTWNSECSMGAVKKKKRIKKRMKCWKTPSSNINFVLPMFSAKPCSHGKL